MSGNQSQQGTKGNETKDTSDDIAGNLSRRSISCQDSGHARENFFVNGRHVFVAGETWSVACESCVLLRLFSGFAALSFLEKECEETRRRCFDARS
jgi:hypothetical protein